MLTRRHFVMASAGAGMACGLMHLANPARAQTVAKPARMLVGFPPGGSIDAVARLIVEHMQGYAPSIIVDNRPGAGGRMALDALKGSEPDGSVILMTPGDQLTLFPHTYSRLGYKPLEDFAPVSTICSVQFLLTIGPVVPASVQTLADFIAWCRQNPALASYGTAGAGTRPHFLGDALARAANFEFVHLPYKGNALAIQNLLGSHVAANISTIGNALPHVRSGALRALATTAPSRSTALPDVPTFREAGYPTVEAVEWFGVLVPAQTSAVVIAALHAALRRVLATAEVEAGFAKLSLEGGTASPAEFAELIKTDTQRWAEVVKASGFTPLE
jgi:tripartite-type tricarboxylate transporter receptor subunit TctC